MISVHPVVGSYDIVVLIEGKDLKEIGDRVTGDIHSIDGIVETMTLPVVEIKIGPGNGMRLGRNKVPPQAQRTVSANNKFGLPLI